MKKNSYASALAIFSLFVVSWLAVTQAHADHNFVAHPSGDEEVPPRDTLAQGQAIFHLSKDGNSLA